MRFATIFTLGITVVSTSASLVVRATVPRCYSLCVPEAPFGSCTGADDRCLCSSPTFVTCLHDTCQSADVGEAIGICLAAGVTLTVSSTGTGTTPTSSATSTVTPTSGSAPATTSGAAATAYGANAFIGGLAAVGLVALAIY